MNKWDRVLSCVVESLWKVTVTYQGYHPIFFAFPYAQNVYFPFSYLETD